MKEFEIGDMKIEEGKLFLIAGLCVVEEEDLTFRTAKALKEITEELKIPFIFKASFDKANRTSIHSYRGPGLAKGLGILKKIKEKLNIPVLSDVHEPYQVKDASRVLDVLQIPAFLCRQTDLILEAAKAGKPINIKKGQFLAPWDVRKIIEKIDSTHNEKILITERGTCFGYNNLIVDFKTIPLMKEFDYPVVFDATHSVQTPGGLGEKSGGDSSMIEPLASAGVAAGCDGLFFEVHEQPEAALSDSLNCLALDDFPPLLKKLLRIKKAL